MCKGHLAFLTLNHNSERNDNLNFAFAVQFISSQLVKLFISLVSHIALMIQDAPLNQNTLPNGSRDCFNSSPRFLLPLWTALGSLLFVSHLKHSTSSPPQPAQLCHRSWLTSPALSLLLMRPSESLPGNTALLPAKAAPKATICKLKISSSLFHRKGLFVFFFFLASPTDFFSFLKLSAVSLLLPCLWQSQSSLIFQLTASKISFL